VVGDGLTIWTDDVSVFEAKRNPCLQLRLRPSEVPHGCDTGYIENQTSDREALRVPAMPSNVPGNRRAPLRP
jgi:hypothetical protein